MTVAAMLGREARAGLSLNGASATAARADRVDVVVIRAGQAGLAIGYFLARQSRRFVILEAADAVGGSALLGGVKDDAEFVANEMAAAALAHVATANHPPPAATPACSRRDRRVLT